MLLMKFVIYLFGYVVYCFSFIVPRSKRIWAFGSFRGAFADNAKYLFVYVSEQCPEVLPVWLTGKKKTMLQVRAAGLRAYTLFSLRGFYYALRSGYYFFNAYTSDICYFTSGRAVAVNLWHGVGLKKIEFCIDRGPLYDRYVRKTLKERFYYPQVYKRPDYFVSSTPFQTVKFAEAFRIPESRCLNVGYPRNDILLMPERERERFIRKFEPERTGDWIREWQGYERIYLYMPTWRESQRNLFAEHLDLEALNEAMKRQQALFVLKPHANTVVESRDVFMRYEHIRFLEGDVDIYPLLPYTHVLITDYSSVLYDYLLMEGKKVILYLYDYDDYVKDRDFNYPFREHVAGELAYSFEELLGVMERNDYDVGNYPVIRRRFWGDYAGDACRMLAERFINFRTFVSAFI